MLLRDFAVHEVDTETRASISATQILRRPRTSRAIPPQVAQPLAESWRAGTFRRDATRNVSSIKSGYTSIAQRAKTSGHIAGWRGILRKSGTGQGHMTWIVDLTQPPRGPVGMFRMAFSSMRRPAELLVESCVRCWLFRSPMSRVHEQYYKSEFYRLLVFVQWSCPLNHEDS